MSGSSEVERPSPDGRPGFWNDCLALWFSPAGLFSSIAERPRWRAALVLLLVLVTLSTFVTLDPLLETMQSRGAAEIRERGGSAEALEILRGRTVRLGLVVTAPLLFLLALAAHAGGAYLVLAATGGLGVERPFTRLFQVATWGRMVQVPRLLLWVPLVLAKGSGEVYFGPAALAAGEGRSALFAVLVALDLFSIWFLVLYALGIKIVLRVSGLRAAVAAVLPWAIGQAIQIATAHL
ncbi:MAG: YIP1 family protein [Candidatus Eisenbacteria bacterium]|nr:YIP1 family protein [Candidatus Eisenbacteria bacterium]